VGKSLDLKILYDIIRYLKHFQPLIPGDWETKSGSFGASKNDGLDLG
jgi:hypothetical protein